MLRLGVVGYGSRIGNMIEGVFRKIDPELRVAGIVDPDEAGARSRLAACDRTDAVFCRSLRELVRRTQPDGLAIGTRCNLHAPYAIEAARYDLPLFLEKPVAISLAQATALERAYRRARAPVVVSFPLRVSPLCERTRGHIEAGAVGAPVHVSAVNQVPYGMCYWERPYRNYAITGGLFLQKATHDLDYLMYLMGKPIVRIAAMGTWHHVFGGRKRRGLRCAACRETDTCLESPANRRRHGGILDQDHLCLFSVDCGRTPADSNEDCSSAVFEFEGGAHGVYSQVFFSRREAGARGATVSGYGGTIGFDWYRNEMKLVYHHAPRVVTETPGQGQEHFGGDRELGNDFLDLLHGRSRVSRTPIATGIQSAYTCLAARESALTGRFVKVRQVGF